MAQLAMCLPPKHEEQGLILRSLASTNMACWCIFEIFSAGKEKGQEDSWSFLPLPLWPASLVCMEFQTNAEVGGFAQTPEVVSFPLHMCTYMYTPHTPREGQYRDSLRRNCSKDMSSLPGQKLSGVDSNHINSHVLCQPLIRARVIDMNYI